MSAIELNRGVVKVETVRSTSNSVPVFDSIGAPLFFVSAIVDDGDISLRLGSSYETAILMADDAAKDWPCEVLDIVAA